MRALALREGRGGGAHEIGHDQARLNERFVGPPRQVGRYFRQMRDHARLALTKKLETLTSHRCHPRSLLSVTTDHALKPSRLLILMVHDGEWIARVADVFLSEY